MSKRALALTLLLAAGLAAIWFLSQRPAASAPGVDGAIAGPPNAPAALPNAAMQPPANDSSRGARQERKTAEHLPDQSGAGAGKATLVLIAVSIDTGALLPRTQFELKLANADGQVERVTAENESDVNGRAEFEVQAGRSVEVDAQLLVEPFSALLTTIAALAPGERREAPIALATARDLHFFCRVLRDEDSARMPLVPAELVHSNPRSGEPVREWLSADAGGLIELESCSWNKSSLQVDLEGYAQAVAPVVAGYETSARAFELRLFRGARLKIEVLDPAKAPLPGLLVRASAHDYELSQSDLWSDRARHVRSTFEATSDVAGRVALSGLPPRAELELSVREGDKTLMRSPVKYRLDPGEEREVQLIVGGKATLAGRAIDQFGRPLEGAEIWLVKPDPSMGMTFRAWTNTSARTKTAADGAFEFQDLAEGEWWVGPALEQGGVQTVAAYGQRAVITPGAGRMEVVLHVWRGLFLSGVVRVNSGELASGCSVLADAIDIEHTGYLSTKTDEYGAFKLGPVCGVEYEIRAGGAFQGDFAQSKPVHAVGGSDSLVLIVDRAAKLRGSVIDAETNEPCDAAILITQAIVSDGFGYGMGSQTQDHAFEMTGISSGVWDVTATSRNARMAISRVSLAAGESQEVTLRVAPSATVVFKNTSPTDFFYVFPSCNGLALQVVGGDPGQEQRIAVPPGRVSLRICDAQAKTITVRTLEIVPGASGEIRYP